MLTSKTNVTSMDEIKEAKASGKNLFKQKNKVNQNSNTLVHRADGTLLVSSLLDTIAKPAQALPVGTDINEEMVGLLNELFEVHQATKSRFMESRRQFVAGLYHFAVSYRENEDKIDAMLKDKEVAFNKGSSYWRKVALLWLNKEADKSVATRYGQVMEYANKSGVDANQLNEAIEAHGIKNTLAELKSRIMGAESPKELPILTNEAAAYFSNLMQNGGLLVEGAQVDFHKLELAPGAVSMELEIDKYGNVQLKGVVQTTFENQVKRLEASYSKSATKNVSNKDIVCLMTDLPDFVTNAVGFMNDGQNIQFIGIGASENPPVFMARGKAANSKEIEWGFVEGYDLIKQVPSGIKNKGVEDFKFKILKGSEVELTIGDKGYVFESYDLTDESVLNTGAVAETSTHLASELKAKLNALIDENDKGKLDIEGLRVALWGENAKNMNVDFCMKGFMETAMFIAKKSSKIVQCKIGEDGLTVEGYANSVTYSLHVKTFKAS